MHINVWAVLSGSGAISGSSDLFFVYRSPDLLLPAVEIRDSSLFSKENVTNLMKKASELYVTVSDNRTTLYARTDELQIKGLTAPKRSLSTTAYVLRGDRFEP